MQSIMAAIEKYRFVFISWVLALTTVSAAAVAGAAYQDIFALEVQIELLKTREPAIQKTEVHVVCECPAYEDGWADAEYAQGCDPTEPELTEDDLRGMCSELAEYGYVPDC